MTIISVKTAFIVAILSLLSNGAVLWYDQQQRANLRADIQSAVAAALEAQATAERPLTEQERQERLRAGKLMATPPRALLAPER